MNQKFTIREEKAADIHTISEVTNAAFRTLQISNHTEHLIIHELRRQKALVLSLVAEQEGTIIGHIAFSPVNISNGAKNWLGLGPVSVLPEFQKKGVGSKLIREGLKRIKQFNAAGCCLVGHPDYYGRFGFKNPNNLGMTGVPPEVFFSLSLNGTLPRGEVSFHNAFTQDYELASEPTIS